MKNAILITIAGFALLAAGCATTQDNTELLQARSAYKQAVNNPQVKENAPVVLHEAEQLLHRAEQEDNEKAVSHYAYLSKKKTELAESLSEFKAAEKEISRLSSEREQYLAELRQREAEQARQKAREAQQSEEATRQRYEQLIEKEEQSKMAEQRRLLEEQKTAMQEQQTTMEQERLAAQLAQAETERLKNELADLKAKQTDRGILLTLGNVLFETDQYTLKPGAERILSQLAATLQSHADQKVIIEGHTDSSGSDAYNKLLSKNRAESVGRFLRERGISADRIAIRGHGEIYPVTTNQTAAGRQQNRRVEIILPRSDEDLRGYFGNGATP